MTHSSVESTADGKRDLLNVLRHGKFCLFAVVQAFLFQKLLLEYVRKSCNITCYVCNLCAAFLPSLDNVPDNLEAMPPLSIEDELRVRRSLTFLITAAKDLVEDPPVNVELASEDLLIDRILAG